MNFFYADASALAKRYDQEVGTSLVNHLFAAVPPGRINVLNVGVAEVFSILVRKRNVGRLSPAAFQQALLNFTAEVVVSTALPKRAVDNALVTAALALIETHSINATDAIILRSALGLAAGLRPQGDDLVLVASDLRLLRAAQAEGLLTFNPEAQALADLTTLL